jgi:glycosyltransferase involved in cell wall biosynthesis
LRILDELRNGELRNRGFNARLDVAGDGPEAAKLVALTARLGLTGSVKFHGWLSRTALEALYHQAHFFLLPSSTEGWPKVLAEAMAFRAVPLAGAVSCIPQILEHSGAGISLPVDDIAGFAREIERIVLSPGLWSRMASNGQRAAAEFTYEAYVERVCQLLQIEHSRPKKHSSAAAA